MREKNVFRLDWLDAKENGYRVDRRLDGQSYLYIMFKKKHFHLQFLERQKVGFLSKLTGDTHALFHYARAGDQLTNSGTGTMGP
ncbi:MAG: hypothetical protein ACOC9D_03420 [Thermodesulfobacteriota bacterium]